MCASTNPMKAIPLTAISIFRAIVLREALDPLMRFTRWIGWYVCSGGGFAGATKVHATVAGCFRLSPGV